MADIQNYNFGNIEVDGKRYDGDIKILDGKVISDWWRKEGHVLDVSDIEDILAEAPEVLVVGTGLPGNMRVNAGLKKHLEDLGITLIEEPTKQAVEKFNKLSKSGKKTAGAFHLTC